MKPRRLPIAAFALFALSALLVALLVIPAVKTDAFPKATPERAIRALWVVFGCNLVLGLFALTLSRAPTAFATLAWRLAACFMAFPAFLMALALTDGGLAFWGHGPGMRTAALTMLGCAAANAVGGILTVAMGLSREKRPAP